MKPIIIILTTISCVFLCTTCSPKLTTPKSDKGQKVNIIPKPLKIKTCKGHFQITPQTKICVESGDSKVLKVGNYLADKINSTIGYNLPVSDISSAKPQPNKILLTTSKADKKLGIEGYTLEVKQHHVVLRANEPAGLFYGVQTILQLLPPEIEHQVTENITWTIPCVKIKDKPRYSWRGMHLDVCRHFFSKEFVKKYIDLLAMHKMNVFHWHLTEDQGWRIEIKKYPKLTEIGAWRVDREDKTWNERELQREGENATYGGFYTQDEIREIVEYAQSRFITIVPEIEMPGHALAALASYPQYSCTGGPFTVRPGGYWPIIDVYCPGNDETFEFLENVLSEVIELFPGKYIHIGGDEVNKTRWQSCPKCQARIKAEGLKSVEELQSYFIKRIEKFLISKKKKLIGWDEILEGGLAPEATVMSWRGMEGGIAASRQGHDVVMSPTSHCYFDYYQADPAEEPEAIGGYLPLEKVYEFEPTPPSLTSKQAKHILGAQGNVWTEYIPTPEHAEYMAAPRMCALSEVVWSAKKHRDLDNFLKRLSFHYLRLDAMDVNYRQPDLLGFNRKNVFINEANVEIFTPRPYAEVRYTLDGNEPTLQSKLYTEFFRLNETTVVTVREFLPNGKVGRIQRGVFEKKEPLKAIQAENIKPGILFQYFELEEQIKSTNELENSKVIKTGIVNNFAFPLKELPEYFGLCFSGFIKVPTNGVYTFTTSSNDGSCLYIGDKLVVDNDGLHGVLERAGQIALANGLHPVRLTYFQGGSSKFLKVYYEGPGISKHEIQPSVLTHAGE